MMTVGEHDRAWYDVMSHRVPMIQQTMKVDLQFRMLKELRDSGLYSTEEYVRDLKELAKCAGFKFDN